MKVGIDILADRQAPDVAGPLDVSVGVTTYLSRHKRYEVSLVGLQAGIMTYSNGMRLFVSFGHGNLDAHYAMPLVTGGEVCKGDTIRIY